MDIKYEDFYNKLQELKDIAMLSGGFVTRETIDSTFPGLDDNQLGFLKEYLEKNHIGIDEPIDPDSFLTESEINLLDMYLESLEGVEIVSDSVKRVLMMEAIAGNKASKEKLMNQYLQTIVDTAKLYSGQGVNMMDLIGEGNVALAISMESLDSVETVDDVEPLIMRMIMNAMEEQVSTASDEEGAEEKTLKLVDDVYTKAKKMGEELLRKVTVAELSEETGLSKKKIKEAMDISKAILDYIEKEEQ